MWVLEAGLIHLVLVLAVFANTYVVESARVPSVVITNTVALSPRKISLSWQPDFTPHRGQLEYVVRYKPKGESGSLRETSLKPEMTLKGLEPATAYVINVRAVNGKARGDWSENALVKTNARKKDSDNELADEDIFITDVTHDAATVLLNLTKYEIDSSNFKGFQIVTKGRNYREEIKTTSFTTRVVGLTEETTYAVNVFIVDMSGEKARLGSTKFKTTEKPMEAPRNLRQKTIADTAISIKWKRLEDVEGYMVEYGPDMLDGTGTICTVHISNLTKWYKLKDLLPSTTYSIRVAGKSKNMPGSFTPWLNLTTSPLVTGFSGISTYNVSPHDVLMKWEVPYPETRWRIKVFQDNIYLTQAFEETGKAGANITNGDTHFTILSDLVPGAAYRVVLTMTAIGDYDNDGHTNNDDDDNGDDNGGKNDENENDNADVDNDDAADDNGDDDVDDDVNGRDNACVRYKVATFSTTSDEPIQIPTETGYDAQLRLFNLPNHTYLLKWTSPDEFTNSSTYLTAVRIRGEPFLHPVSSHIIPEGHQFLHLSDLDPDKTYSVEMIIFKVDLGLSPVFTQKLVVIPIHVRMPSAYEVTTGSTSYGTSLDLVLSRDIATNAAVLKEMDSGLERSDIPGTNFTVLSRSDVNNSTDHIFPSTVPVTVHNINNVSVTVGTAVDVTCVTTGDYFPTVSWRFVSLENDVTQFMKVNDSKTVTVTSVRYVGIDPRTGQAFLGTRSFLTIDPVTFGDEGRYECIGSNVAGSEKSTFSLTVNPPPPGPVKNLMVTPASPFQIICRWAEPEVDPRDPRGRVKLYHVIGNDQYGVPLKIFNVTDTKAVLKGLQPNKQYHIFVSAINSVAEGNRTEAIVRTKRIPALGPPLNVTIITLNGTTMTISWLPPKGVQERQIKLRAYVFYHRQQGSNYIEEMQIGKAFTNISMIELEAEEKYEVQVVALSEDGQRSHSSWVKGNTTREAYMNETIPPPPPHNVYLRHVEGNIIVTWHAPHPDENILVRGYIIDVYHNKTRREAMTVGYKESSVIIYDVEMGVSYQISVRTKNKMGSSLEAWAELYVPKQYVTKEPVQNFHGVALTSTKLQLFWDAPLSGLYNRFVMSYTLTGDIKPELPGGGNLPSSVRYYIVRSLEPFTEYIFNITPFWRNLRGTTVNATVRTFSDKPSSPPGNVTLATINSTTILVKCAPPEKGKNGIISQYRISYREKQERGSILVDADENEELNYYLSDLEHSTVYEMRIRALTVNGSGPWSVWVQSKTSPREPVMPKLPRNLTTTATSETVTLSWIPPEQPISDLSGFMVGYGRFIPEVYRFSLSARDNEFTFKNLDGESVYIVSVRSFNDFGESAAVFDLVTTL